jgi:hypothetical protein
VHRDEARKYFFFEKKKQKTFNLLVMWTIRVVRSRRGKSFFDSFFGGESLSTLLCEAIKCLGFFGFAVPSTTL